MKSRVLIAIILLVSVLVLIGCGSKKTVSENNQTSIDNTQNGDVVYVTIGDEKFKLNNETNLNDLHYLENFVDFHTDRIGNIAIMNYSKGGDVAFEIRMYFDEEHSLDDMKATFTDAEEGTKESNGITYTYYTYKNDDGIPARAYLYEYNNVAYTIIFYLGENPGDIEEVFMNNVYFK